MEHGTRYSIRGGLLGGYSLVNSVELTQESFDVRGLRGVFLGLSKTGLIESYAARTVTVAAAETLEGGEGEASEIGGRHIPGCGGGTGGTKVTVFEIDV